MVEQAMLAKHGVQLDDAVSDEQTSVEEDRGWPLIAATFAAQGDMVVSHSGALVMKADQDIEIHGGGAQAMVAGRDIRVTHGGAQVLVAGGDIELNHGGAYLVRPGRDLVARRSFVGIALSRVANFSEESRVLLTVPQAIALGAALGASFALVYRWLKQTAERMLS